MEAVRKSLTRLRSGFVLPMSLVVTVLTLTLVGASARYCTTAMATSNEYLSRTLGRLAAQSTIEKVKILVRDQSATRASAMLSGGTDSFTDRISEVIEGVAESNELREFLSDMRWDEAHRATSDTTVFVDIKSEQDSDLYRILATAEVRKGNRKTTITLQEGIRVPLEDTDIYKYAYFVNGDGHLVCKNLVVNGDVRANGDFYLSGVNINGFVYFTNKVELASNAATWWSGKYVTMLTADAYNRAMRGDTWAKARPTDPLKKGLAWEGGYREPLDNTGKITSLGQFLKLLIDYILNRHNYTDGEVPIVDADHETANAPKEKVIRKAGALTMPKIVFDNETENANNHKLLYYEQKAQDARGSLVCSNAYIDANGKVQKLSAKIKVKWQNGVFGADKWGDSTPAEQERTTTFDPTDPANLPEGVTGKEVVNENFEAEKDRDAASMLFPRGSIPVYNAIPAATYDSLPDDQKVSWRMLSGNRPTGVTIVGGGTVGDHSEGFANFNATSLQGMYKDSSLFNDGKGLFIAKSSLESSLVTLSRLDSEASDLSRVKFNDIGWMSCEAEYDGDTWEKGVEVIDSATKNLEVYGWRTDNPLTWTRIRTLSGNTGYYNTVMGVKTVSVFVILGYVDIDVEGGFFTQSSIDNLARSFTGYKGVSADDSVFKEWGGGWSPCSSGYYSDEDRYLRGYWVFHLLRTYERDVSSYSVQRQYVEKLSSVVRPMEHKEKVSDIHYTGTYYSSKPAGYMAITVNTNWVNQTVVKDVKFEYTPFETKYEPVPARTNIVDVQFMTLRSCVTKDPRDSRNYKQVGSSGAIQSGYNHNGTSVPKSGFANRLFDETELTPIAEKFATDYDLDPSDITGLFGSFDGWSHFAKSGWTNPNIWYKPSDSSSGFVAVQLYEVTKGSEHLDYFVDYTHATATEKSAIEKAQQAAQASDVVETLYIPLHEYKASPTSAERASGKWVQLSHWVGGYQDTSTAKTYKGRFILTSDITEIGKTLDDKYDVGENTLLNNFTASRSGWTSRTSGWYNTDPSGYFRIKVTKKTTSYPRPSTTYSLSYSYVANWSGAEDEDPSEVANEVPDGSIPVYGLSATESTWKSISTVPGGGYRNSASTQFVKKNELDDIVDDFTAAAAADESHKRLTADALREEVMSYFAAAGWKSAGTSGRYKENPIGYLTLKAEYDDANRFREIGVDFHVLSVDAGEVGYAPGEKKTYDGDYYINDPSLYWKDHPDEIPPSQEPDLDWPPSIFGPPTELIGKNHEGCVERVLRGIFVQEGNRIITSGDHGYTLPGATQYLQTPPEDDILTATKSMKTGSKTSELRPFREDPLCQCNRRTEELAGGAADDEGAVFLIGTWDFPIVINGTVVFTSDVLIRGFVTGHGTIVSGRNIHIIGDICYKNPPFWPYAGGSEPSTKGKDRLELVSRGSIVFGNYARRLDNTYVDKAWEKLLSGHYIDGFKNTSDTTSRGVPYLDKDYTREDQNGGRTRQKIVHKNNRLERETVRYYESVVGDYVFLSHNATDVTDSSNNAVPELPDLNAVSKSESDYNDCRLSQFWDFNPSDVASGNTNYFPYATYQSSLIEGWANAQNFTEQDRVGVSGGAPGKSFSYIWKQSTFGTYARNNYASKFGSATKPLLNRIQTVNAVLYASQGVYGVFGGYKTPAVLNGALLAQEESLLPFANMQSTIFSWGTGNDLKMTINWDIRLNRKSADSVKNGEDTDEYGGQMKGSGSDSSEPGDPIPVFWQEVPDSFNEEYHATP